MSGNNLKGSNARRPKLDRRVRRTRDALGDSLVKLMHEKPFAEITVQQVLDHAGVSRSTFYSHFSDKNDLLLGDVEEFFEAAASALSRRGDSSRRIAPVREMFSHIAEWRTFYDAMVASGKIQDVMEIGQQCFARAIEQRLTQMAIAGSRGFRSRVQPSHGQPALKSLSKPDSTALSQMLAGGLMSLMTWWLYGGQSLSADQMDDLYHEFAWTGIVDRLRKS